VEVAFFGRRDVRARGRCPSLLHKAAALVCARAGGSLQPWVSPPQKSPKLASFKAQILAAVAPNGDDSPQRVAIPTPREGTRACCHAQAPPGQKKFSFALRSRIFDTPICGSGRRFSPDLNPLQFSIYGVLEIRELATTHTNFAALLASISRLWAALDEEFVSNCSRLNAAA
jgi:hypothetical protein